MYVCMKVCMYVWMYGCMDVWMYVYVYIYVFVHLCVHGCVHVYVLWVVVPLLSLQCFDGLLDSWETNVKCLPENSDLFHPFL